MGDVAVQASNSSSRDHTSKDLADHERHVDHLLTQYLHLLDEYTKARDALSKQLSAGFMSLADANFTAPRGVRYGQDFFDQRMQASRIVDFEETEGRCEISVVKTNAEPDQPCSGDVDRQAVTEPAEDATALDEPSTVDKQVVQSLESVSAEDKDDPPAANRSMTNSAKLQAPTDPLLWFGVFVSPKLRSTQNHFVKALESAGVLVLNTDSKMKLLEIEIRRQRKYIAKLKS